MRTVTVDYESWRRESKRILAMEKRVAELEAELRAATLLLGYLIHDHCDDDGEISIMASTMQRYSGFVLTRKETPSGALLLSAKPV